MAASSKDNQYYDPYNGGQFNPLPGDFAAPAVPNTPLGARMATINAAAAQPYGLVRKDLSWLAGAGFARAEEATRNARSEIKRQNTGLMGDLLGVGADADAGAFGGPGTFLGQIWGDVEENEVKHPGKQYG